jgi:hypothetical protein
MIRWAAIAILAAASGWLGGCSTGELTLDYTVAAEMQSMTYHVDNEGGLTVKGEDSGIVEGKAANALYTTQLSGSDLKKLKQVISGSGFFLASPPDRGWIGAGPSIRAEIHMGLWENQLEVFPGQERSVDAISEELNRHLPAKLHIPSTGRQEKTDMPEDSLFKGM